jgi:hypothetical protein
MTKIPIYLRRASDETRYPIGYADSEELNLLPSLIDRWGLEGEVSGTTGQWFIGTDDAGFELVAEDA